MQLRNKPYYSVYNDIATQSTPASAKNYLIFTLCFFLLTSNESCKKFVTLGAPITQISSSAVYTDDATAIASIKGIYIQMMSSSDYFASGGSSSITVLGGLSSDELIDYSKDPERNDFYTNSLKSTSSIIENSLWSQIYQYIYYANSIIEDLANSSQISMSVKTELNGEAKFIRAFCHLYLTNLFGNVPLVMTTDYRVNATAMRTSKAKVYEQIITDLKDAQLLLPDDYSIENGQRIRPNKWAATALLARVYLYTNDWSNAIKQSTAIINNTANYSLVQDINSVFLPNSSEAIWQLMPVLPGYNTLEGNTFILVSTPNIVALSSAIVNSFEINDKRRINWIDSIVVDTAIYYYPYKYKIHDLGLQLGEYSMVLRLAEQFLIRAEASAQQNNIEMAQTDLNVIRNRAGLPNTTANDQMSLLLAVEHERLVELFAEWGHRWIDLKRTNREETVLGPIKGDRWQSSDSLYPIPQSEIKNDRFLIQNPGY